MSILIKNGKLVYPDQIAPRDILIEGEKIQKVDNEISLKETDSDLQIIDAKGKYILPGIIDAHTHYHLKSRNSVTADDFYSGSRAAAFGGVTTFVDFADQLEGKSLPESIENRRKEADDEVVIDYSLHQSVYSLHSGYKKDFARLREIGINNIKMFTTYREEGYMIEDEKWDELFTAARDNKLLITVHAEDEKIIKKTRKKYDNKKSYPPEFHPKLRPSEAEYRAIKQVGELAIKYDVPVFIVHLSSKEGLKAVEEIKDGGGRIFVETSPHYFTLDNSYLGADNPQLYFMTPPLRSKEDNKKILKALDSNLIDTVGTDHCSFTPKQKFRSSNSLDILPGIPGSETLLPLTHKKGVNEGYIDIKRLVALLAEKPARIYGLYPQKGSLKEGTDADLVIFDPDQNVTISSKNQHTAAGYTPYEGIEVRGYPETTISRGEVIVKNGEFKAKKGRGKFVEMETSSCYK